MVRPLDPDVTVEPIPDRDQALAWFDRERQVLNQAVELAAAADRVEHAWRLAAAIGVFVDRRGRWDDWISALRTALSTAQRLGDPTGQANAHSGLGLARSRLGHHVDAHHHLAQALALFEALGDGLGRAYTHLRMCAVSEGLSRPADCLTHAQSAHDLFADEGHEAGRAQALNNLGWYHAQLGSYGEAIDRCAESVALGPAPEARRRAGSRTRPGQSRLRSPPARRVRAGGHVLRAVGTDAARGRRPVPRGVRPGPPRRRPRDHGK
ncbi:tetratricopeptide repeat protein [Micromonospora halophytica]|uniref:tetratricopeptide repeat protein n=1 Tax=Micromonospora halophytica TaxID=47864 RepID=UPI001112E20D